MLSSPAVPPTLQPRRRGCLTGCITQSLAALALGLVLVYALYGLLAPWAFYLGTDTFHAIPGWTGWGRMHSNNLGDFALYVRIEPSFRGNRVYRASNLTGNAWLCTPRGETFRMHLGGGMRYGLGSHINGEKISLYMHNWPIFTGNFTGDHRPSLEFRGQWQNPNIVLDDHGTLAWAFLPDGTVYRSHSPNYSPQKETVPLTLHPGSWYDFKSTCSALASAH
jgi:hypothetical protein